ncbi:hypothetical protein BKH42_00940 [Helicobacter sp. 13S00482-2]|uniref:molybdenum cofactor guanylyltransferase MobA n=1 Tax=Helicobacter sp. 13S00482-2 TaxID=1476200 RepID=UPI000BA4FCA2|nr:molybdenum cofactor guanylyltransferase MobA [Helicobacter sp. 13S00482-2]PAF54507.1 hypothetical protein BKH42_00940 [Helicobacter sp. 13S00482-2]
MFLIQNIPCVILAGGKSSRMGENKALLPFGKLNLISYEYQKMCKIFQNVFISCKKGILPEFEKNTLIEKDEIFSPLVGIRNAFLALKASKIFFLSVDTPFVKNETIHRICSIEGSYDVIYPSLKGRSHYLISLWNKSTLEELQTALNGREYKIGNLIDKLQTLAISLNDEEEFYNLNTPLDYQNAIKNLKDEDA